MASVENQEITVPENVGYNYYWAEWSYGCKGLSYNVCVVANWCEFVLVLFSIWPLEEHVLVNSFIVRHGDVLTCGYSASFGTVVHQRRTLYIKGSPDSVHDMGQAWFCVCYLTSGGTNCQATVDDSLLSVLSGGKKRVLVLGQTVSTTSKYLEIHCKVRYTLWLWCYSTQTVYWFDSLVNSVAWFHL